MRRTRQRSIVCFFIGLAFLQVPIVKSSAQIEGGSISGVIKDSESGAVASAKVTALLENSQPTSKSFEVMTDSEGNFTFNNLPAGTYGIRVSVERSLFKPETKTNIRVRKSQNTRVDFRLKYAQACDDTPSQPSKVSDSDKAEIIRLTLEEALVKKKIPDYNLLIEGKESIVLSTKNIKPSWVSDLPGYKLALMSPSEIQKKADSGGDFLHLSFVEFKVKGSCVAVTLANSWAVGKNSGKGYLSGGGFTYEYRKQSGKWVGKGISGWIS
jgi:hypothetical protein